jgi:hypothetical protein
MGQMTAESFSSVEEVPDLVLPHMLLPLDRPGWHAVKEAVATKQTTTPVEVSFVAMSYALVLTTHQEVLLSIFEEQEIGPQEIRNIFENNTGNHVTRALF